VDYRVVITEMNIDETSRPEVFRYVVQADSDADAATRGRERFTEQHGREPAPRALVDVESLG
jgi:hypothetical protein